MALLDEVWSAANTLRDEDENAVDMPSIQRARELRERQQYKARETDRTLIMNALNSLPKKIVLIVDLTDGDVCSVCMDRSELQDDLRILPCSHSFHAKCVDTWIINKKTCPLCRTNVLQELERQATEMSAKEAEVKQAERVHDKKSLKF